MLYPSQGHGFTDPASWIDEYSRIERTMDEHLELEEGPTPAEEVAARTADDEAADADAPADEEPASDDDGADGDG